MRLRAALLVGAFAVALFALPAGGALSAQSSQTYIVQMLDAPAVTYDGGVSGIPATKPGKGKKINPEAANVKRYRAHLNREHDQAIERVGGAEKVYDYGVTFNGFAAVMTEAQAEEMKAARDVISVTPDRIDLLETSTTPEFLGLSGPTGFWQTTGAVGEDVVIGVLDTGYWPENPAYSDRSQREPDRAAERPEGLQEAEGLERRVRGR